MRPVRHPARRNWATNVLWFGARERSLKITPWAEGISPVMSVDRFGMQTGLLT